MPATKVDSILPFDEAVERFLAGAPRPERLRDGAKTTNELVQRFVIAIERNDTAALAAMLVSRAEYGALYYPSSIYARKPYELPPDIAWLLSSENSAKALRRLVERLGGRPIELGRAQCADSVTEGANIVLDSCNVTYRSGGTTIEGRRLFRSIIGRDGEMKFLSYAGDL